MEKIVTQRDSGLYVFEDRPEPESHSPLVVTCQMCGKKKEGPWGWLGNDAWREHWWSCDHMRSYGCPECEAKTDGPFATWEERKATFEKHFPKCTVCGNTGEYT